MVYSEFRKYNNELEKAGENSREAVKVSKWNMYMKKTKFSYLHMQTKLKVLFCVNVYKMQLSRKSKGQSGFFICVFSWHYLTIVYW